MRSFESLNEKEILALAISQEEEDARIYDDFADGLKENYPEQAQKFAQLRREEDGHRHRLIELYREPVRRAYPADPARRTCGVRAAAAGLAGASAGLEGGAEGSRGDGAGDEAVL